MASSVSGPGAGHERCVHRAGHGAGGRACRPPRCRRPALVVLVDTLGFGGVELGGDQRIVLGAQVDLIVEVAPGTGAVNVVAGLQVLLALEGLDLLNGYLELVRDPRVGASLTDPGADTVQFWS